MMCTTGGPKSVHFPMPRICGTIQDTMTRFHQNVQRSHETKDFDAVFMQLLNVLCKLAQHYYTIIIYDGHVLQPLLY